MSSGDSGSTRWSSSSSVPSLILSNREGYPTWKFKMRNYLIHEDLWCTTEGYDTEDKTVQVIRSRNDKKALAKICLTVDGSAITHIRSAKTALEAWKALQDAYEDKGFVPNRAERVEDIYFRFYNGSTFEENVDIRLQQALDLLNAPGFCNNWPMMLYMHGYKETAVTESVRVMVTAYLEGRPDTNIVLLDWSNMASGDYLDSALPNAKKAGVAVAEQLNNLLEAGLSLETLHIIGHSLGGHLAGTTARELKKKYHKTVKRLTALDPALWGYYLDNEEVWLRHVKATDAEFVDVIHTDAGGVGAPVRTGTADFWPNGGTSTQPGCPWFAQIPRSDDSLCSHSRSWWFYAESLRRPEAFPASPAMSYMDFMENPTPEVGLVYMGVACNTSAVGSYYLTTNAQTPFGKGMDGIHVHMFAR